MSAQGLFPSGKVLWFLQWNNPIPGVSCGVAGTKNDVCCGSLQPFSLDFNQSLGNPVADAALGVFKPILGPVEGLFNTLIGGVLGKLIEVGNNMNDSLVKITKKPNENRCLKGGKPQSSGSSCFCVLDDHEELVAIRDLCKNISDPGEKRQCESCLVADTTKNEVPGVWTAIGCVRSDPTSFIRDVVFRLGIGLAGTLALLCIMYGAFSMQISQGNPEKLKKAQELITSCIMGLILIIFSVFILRFIGLDILGLPGFSR